VDIDVAIDGHESPDRMEPLLISEGSPHRPALADLVVDLVAHSSGFCRSLPAGVRTALADLVRAVNCYYSNLIEGHDTHPVDIERALNDDYSTDPTQRDLQLEARAHIAVQQWIDRGGLKGRWATVEGLCEIHRRFGERLPEALLWVEEPKSGEPLRVAPGEVRRHDVRISQHIPISPGALPRFLSRFADRYGGLGRAETILAAAAAHHRLLWIHPFLDGNGRVARLMSHAMLLESLDTGGVWSIARGLARTVERYKRHLSECDLPRRNDLDGRGHLSEEALIAFTRFFLESCLDQVRFMEGLVQPDRLRSRILRWVEDEVRTGSLPAKAGAVLEAILYRGELPRGAVAELLGTSPRHARRVVAALTGRGVLVAEGPRAPLHLTFPAVLAPHWMPGLFPEPHPATTPSDPW